MWYGMNEWGWGGKGFDEYLNVVLDEAEEVTLSGDERTPIGEFLRR